MKNSIVHSWFILGIVALLLCPPAFAGHWDKKSVWSGKITTTIDGQSTDVDWLPNGTNVNVLTTVGSGSKSVTTAGKVTVTFTYLDDTPSVPPPDEVYVIDTGTAYTRSFNQFKTASVPNSVSVSGSASSSVSPGALTILTNYPTTYEAQYGETSALKPVKISAGASFTREITLSATTTGTFTNGSSGLTHLKATVSGGVSIHPTPYNFHRINDDVVYTDSQQGNILFFDYRFNSTSGSLGDLTHCYWHERLKYGGQGAPDPFIYPSPFDGGAANPTVFPQFGPGAPNMTDGQITDGHLTPAWITPITSGNTYSAAQRYEYNDTTLGENDILIPSPTGDNVATIVRTIEQRPTPYIGWWYSISKQGFTNWTQITGN